ncbi:hypothetical protein BU25DRAFT_414500, partial [Macroventuria anomochaeta]
MPMYLEHSRSQQSVYKGSLPSCSDNSCLQFKLNPLLQFTSATPSSTHSSLTLCGIPTL